MEITWTSDTTFEGVSGSEVGVIVETAVRVAHGKLVAVTVGREE